MTYKQQFLSKIDALKKENNIREFIEVSRRPLDFPLAHAHKIGADITVWCSNDYLGLGQNPQVIQAMSDAAHTYGVGAGGTRNISGNNHMIVQLEKQMAAFHNKDNALVFTSGYVTNRTCLGTLNKIIPDLTFFSDACNHASIIEGLKGTDKKIFKHNDLDDLRNLLATQPKSKNKIIVFESVYSMNGNKAPIKDIVDLAKEFNALTYIDEVHAVGLYGSDGAGVVSETGLKDQIDIIQGTFGKAFGVMGGYIAAAAEIIESIRCYASGFIFTTAIPPANAAAILKSLEIINSEQGQALRTQLHNNVKIFRDKLTTANIRYMDNPSHITPIIIGDSKRCKEISDQLLDQDGIYIQPINYPTVPKKTERFRITLSPSHNEKSMDDLINALKRLL